jgi:hypothetical protein
MKAHPDAISTSMSDDAVRGLLESARTRHLIPTVSFRQIRPEPNKGWWPTLSRKLCRCLITSPRSARTTLDLAQQYCLQCIAFNQLSRFIFEESGPESAIMSRCDT